MANHNISKWHRELGIFCRIKPMILIEGNIHDIYQYPDGGSAPDDSLLRLPDYLYYFFKDTGYDTIVFFDNLHGFYNFHDEYHLMSFADLTNSRIEGRYVCREFKGKVNSASCLIQTAMRQKSRSTVVILNLSSRYIISPNYIDQAETDSFSILMRASMEASDIQQKGKTLKNLIIMIVDKVNDIPVWFYLRNPNVRTINICPPSKEEREALISGERFPGFFSEKVIDEDWAYYKDHPRELEKIRDKFVGLTEGFSNTEIRGLRELCCNENTRIRDMSSVIDLYRYGIQENPWNMLRPEEIRHALDDFRKRVKGQDLALIKTLDVIKRAVTGMAGIQGVSHSKPKGVLYFAGPTGVGKTETAKALAEKLFGDESRCIRFDMSEYGQAHSDQKLLGAPPGYIGYEAGGQLTNAVKENPFSILLFDEIEKAHPTIFDKFLQILDDGRMTDGQGNTVYFTECIIIFTSNLGIYSFDENGKRVPTVTSDMKYPDIQENVRTAIEDYFKLELGRPELLNRIGENIIVFDFIRPSVAIEILDNQVNKIIRNLAYDKHITLTISDEAMGVLRQKALGNLINGGRGIANIVESLLINPLARYLFDEEVQEHSALHIEEIDAENVPYSLTCRVDS